MVKKLIWLYLICSITFLGCDDKETIEPFKQYSELKPLHDAQNWDIESLHKALLGGWNFIKKECNDQAGMSPEKVNAVSTYIFSKHKYSAIENGKILKEVEYSIVENHSEFFIQSKKPDSVITGKIVLSENQLILDQTDRLGCHFYLFRNL